ncbi:hypothetical protein SAMN05660841_02693 [Sphingobacterium nematocida]|uniref:Uncharacterized protein n=1 Tax=Sphingobacterium nematocida TaxID=1513896 RepID=A0A1T5EPC4_9SPHI|nr:hypothetical protein SAMN05660841_02693 [Sphingobacterium nematocida]
MPPITSQLVNNIVVKAMNGKIVNLFIYNYFVSSQARFIFIVLFHAYVYKKEQVMVKKVWRYMKNEKA